LFVFSTIERWWKKFASLYLNQHRASQTAGIADVCKKIQGIKMAHAVTGQFDVVAYADRIRMDDLKTTIEKIQNLKWVRRTKAVTAKPPTIGKQHQPTFTLG
jgi:uncharacterized protein YlbG (UPF0298 family)